MIEQQIQLKRSDVPEGWSYESADFINKVIIKTIIVFAN